MAVFIFSPSYYTILQIPKNSSLLEIKAAYKRLILEVHPDRNPNDENANKKTIMLNDAYAVLYKYPELKAKYDIELNQFENDLKIRKEKREREKKARQNEYEEQRKSKTTQKKSNDDSDIVVLILDALLEIFKAYNESKRNRKL